MTKSLYPHLLIQVLVIGLLSVTPAFAQGEHKGMGMMGDAAMGADMQVFHQLFDHRSEITRQVIKREDGIDTITESTNPEVTRLLQGHVASMLARVKDGLPIHQRDPLFVELFKNAGKIETRQELTAGGVRVIETSKDAYVVKLLSAHAEVIGAFLANGMSEMMKNHPVPPR